MNIEVAYAGPHVQRVISVEVDPYCSVKDAIITSGILEHFPEIHLEKHSVGIFSRRVKLDDLVQEGDRIEIYRTLQIDPKQARRIRAEKEKN